MAITNAKQLVAALLETGSDSQYTVSGTLLTIEGKKARHIRGGYFGSVLAVQREDGSGRSFIVTMNVADRCVTVYVRFAA